MLTCTPKKAGTLSESSIPRGVSDVKVFVRHGMDNMEIKDSRLESALPDFSQRRKSNERPTSSYILWEDLSPFSLHM